MRLLFRLPIAITGILKGSMIFSYGTRRRSKKADCKAIGLRNAATGIGMVILIAKGSTGQY